MRRMLKQITFSASEKKTVYTIFHMTMEWLEKYIEIAGYYPDWKERKTFKVNHIKRTDIDNSKEAESAFSVALFGFKQALRNKPPFLLTELKKQFYQWIDKTG